MDNFFSLAELVGTATGLAGIWLTVRRHVWCWPIILVSILCYMYVFWEAKLYANMLLQFFFFGVSVYGWRQWSATADDEHHIMSLIAPKKVLLASIVAVLPLTLASGFLLEEFTDSSVAYWDALITSLSIVAQVLLARKYAQNWIFWIVTDIIAVFVYFGVGLYLTSALYGVYGIMAAIGYREWIKMAKSAP